MLVKQDQYVEKSYIYVEKLRDIYTSNCLKMTAFGYISIDIFGHIYYHLDSNITTWIYIYIYRNLDIYIVIWT